MASNYKKWGPLNSYLTTPIAGDNFPKPHSFSHI